MFFFSDLYRLKNNAEIQQFQNNKKWLISNFLNLKKNVEIPKFSLFKIMFTY